MRSDHWNFLANLLGTSGSSDSPKKKAPKPKPVVSSSEPDKSKAESTSSSSSLAHDSKESSEGGFGSSERPQRRHAPTPVTSESSGDSPKNVEDVLDALRSATPPQKIPGFGPPKKTEAAAKPVVETSRPADTAKRQAFQDRPRDPVGTASLAEKSKPTDPEDASLDRAWGSLANQLGVSVDKDFSLEREPKAKTEGRQERKPSVSRDRDSASADRDSASAAQPKRSGFGTGLVDNSDQDVDDSDSGFGAPRRAKPAPQSRERSAEPKSSAPRTRETESGEDSSGKFISKKSSFEDKDSERGERGPRRRGRRRGVRQRMTEDDLDRNEGSAKTQEDAPKAAREDQPRRGSDSNRAAAGSASAATAVTIRDVDVIAAVEADRHVIPLLVIHLHAIHNGAAKLRVVDISDRLQKARTSQALDPSGHVRHAAVMPSTISMTISDQAYSLTTSTTMNCSSMM